MLFNPYSDECTTFVNVRVLKFNELSFEVTITRDGKSFTFKNTKPLKIFYKTDTPEIINTLQEVSLVSDKMKLKCRLDELIERSEIQETLNKWIVSSVKSTN